MGHPCHVKLRPDMPSKAPSFPVHVPIPVQAAITGTARSDTGRDHLLSLVRCKNRSRASLDPSAWPGRGARPDPVHKLIWCTGGFRACRDLAQYRTLVHRTVAAGLVFMIMGHQRGYSTGPGRDLADKTADWGRCVVMQASGGATSAWRMGRSTVIARYWRTDASRRMP